MTLAAVLFDLWGTLILDTPERSRPRQVRRANLVLEAAREHGLELAFEAVDTALINAMRVLTALQDDGRDVDSAGRAQLLRDELANVCGAVLPDQALPAVEAAITGLIAEHAPHLEPSAAAVLAEIRSLGLATALVSNAGFTTSPALRWLLEMYGLTPCFDALLFSDELGIAKPHPLMFSQAVACLGASSETCVFVGDSPHNDIFGAQSAGIFAVQVGLRSREGIAPQATIEDLAGLLPALRSGGLLPARPGDVLSV